MESRGLFTPAADGAAPLLRRSDFEATLPSRAVSAAAASKASSPRARAAPRVERETLDATTLAVELAVPTVALDVEEDAADEPFDADAIRRVSGVAGAKPKRGRAK